MTRPIPNESVAHWHMLPSAHAASSVTPRRPTISVSTTPVIMMPSCVSATGHDIRASVRSSRVVADISINREYSRRPRRGAARVDHLCAHVAVSGREGMRGGSAWSDRADVFEHSAFTTDELNPGASFTGPNGVRRGGDGNSPKGSARRSVQVPVAHGVAHGASVVSFAEYLDPRMARIRGGVGRGPDMMHVVDGDARETRARAE